MENSTNKILDMTNIEFKQNSQNLIFELDLVLEDCVVIETCGSSHTSFILDDSNHQESIQNFVPLFFYQFKNFQTNKIIENIDDISLLKQHLAKIEILCEKLDFILNNLNSVFPVENFNYKAFIGLSNL